FELGTSPTRTERATRLRHTPSGQRVPEAGRPGGRRYPQRMADRIRVACVQMTSRQDKAANLERAESLVARAASTGADVVVLPEKWNQVGSADDYRAAAEPLAG